MTEYTGSRGLDLLGAICVVVAALWVAQPPTALLRGGRLYVSPAGSDWNLGATPASAVRSLQRAADLVGPGEEVVILPGTYAGNLRLRRGGQPGRPVVFRAQQPGTVTLSGAASAGWDAGLVWADAGDGIRWTQPPWPVYALRQGDINAFHVSFGGLARLRQLVRKPGAWPAFTYDADKRMLYVFLPGGQDPASASLVTHPPMPSPREWGMLRAANVWVQAPHVVFEGLRFDFGVGAGLLLWRTSDVTVRDSSFTGAHVGIGAAPSLQVPRRVTVERSLYHNYPQYHWLRHWLSWDDVYAHHADSSLLSLGGAGHVVRSNLVLHGGDSLQLSPARLGEAFGARVSGNALLWGTDDAIEFDGPAWDVRFESNLVYDHFVSLALSPVLVGPVVVEGNRFLHPAGGVNGAQLKLANPWHGKGGDGDAPVRNIRVRHNVFVGNWLAWDFKVPLEQVHVQDNVFAVQNLQSPPFPVGVDARDNALQLLPPGSYPNPGAQAQWWRPLSFTKPTQAATGATSRPGPWWLDWTEHPATRDIARSLPEAGWSSAPLAAGPHRAIAP